MRIQRIALAVLALTQVLYGVLFMVSPSSIAGMLHLEPAAPPWFSWLMTGVGARFICYGIGLIAAAQSPRRHRLWINLMILIQAADFIAIAIYMANGTLPSQDFMHTLWPPLLWIAVLIWTSYSTRGSLPRHPSTNQTTTPASDVGR